MMTTLQAGPLTVRYAAGFIRRVTYGENEILRMVYFALRDHNWNSIKLSISNENIIMHENDFTISYDGFHMQNERCLMEWKAKIEGRPDGSIIFTIQGEALENFKKNRAGFCVLHPLNIANEECKITHPDGNHTIHHFPLQISPENPFKKIKSMDWQTSGTAWNLSFEGDIFETEDQRNWSDASFKTFCTPLDQPFPVELKKGDKVFQRVTFKPALPLKHVYNNNLFVSLFTTGKNTILPDLGIGASTEVSLLSPTTVSLLRALNLSHYRIDIFPAVDNWVTRFSQDYENAFTLGLPVEVALHLTLNYSEESEAFILLCQQNHIQVKKVLLLSSSGMVTSMDLLKLAPVLRKKLANVLIGGGTNYNYNELNKNRFSANDLDFISFATDPQEHADDDLTIFENLEAQAHLVNSTKMLYGSSMPVHISPVTLRKRFNPYATNPIDFFISENLKADPRQKEIFAAIWTFGSMCQLTKAGASSVTYFQTIGNQGIITDQGDCYPVYEVLKEFAAFQGKPVQVLDSSDPFKIQAIQFDTNLLGLVNLTDLAIEVRLDNKRMDIGPHEISFQPLHRAQKF